MSSFVNLLDIVYPIGSVYFSTNTTSPASTVGGTWTSVAADTFICSGTPLSTGGSNSKTLSADEIPGSFWETGNQRTYTATIQTSFTPGNIYGIRASPTREANSFDLRPKYLAFNIWYRVS
jgi:hypothetical protein